MIKIITITAVILLALIAPAQAADTYVDRMIKEKRKNAEAKRMKALQDIQHRQADPEAYLKAKYSNTGNSDKISFDMARDGHFYVPANMDGRNMQFLADTGATSIFVSQDDARKMGINMANLNYNRRYQTANGAIGKAAKANIRKMKVGPIELKNVPITVSGEKSHMALLGMEFFSRVSKYAVEDNKLTIYK